MKRVCKFIPVSTTLFDTPDLSVLSKWVLIALDSVYDGGQGVSIGIQGLSSLTNLPGKTVKECLTELYEHGAVEVLVCDGQKFLKPLMYRESYPKVGEKPVIGDKPSDTASLPYDEIADKWGQICSSLPKVTRWSPQRKNRLKSALKQAGLTVEDLYKVFNLISTSSFLNGTKTDQWQCSFDWITKSSNLIKILEGNYHKDYSEKRMYDEIMQGKNVNKPHNEIEDFYR